MATDKLSTQTQITIVAVVAGSKVKLFLANSGVSLDAGDTVKDRFAGSTTASSVTVTVLSANGPVSVTNKSGSWTWAPAQVSAGGSTVYYSTATGDIPSAGNSVTDKFNIQVNGISADPTVVLTRGGTNNNLVLGSGPRQD